MAGNGQHAGAGVPGAQAAAGNPRALVVDDDARLAAMVAEYLGANEIEVTVAPDGERGLQALGKQHFDVVLLDVMLPGLDGLEVCRRIRSMPEHQDVPVVMLTA
jgi:DNA-binding response OmpR family regulator